MYDRLNCLECQNYEFDDSTLDNNCIHYRFCIKNIKKLIKELKKKNNKLT